MKKTIAVLLFSTIMISLLFGCGSGTPLPEETPPVVVSIPPVINPDFVPSEADGGVFVLPVVGEPVTFSIFAGFSAERYGMVENNDSTAYSEAEKRTGIHIKWSHSPIDEEEFAFMKIISSGDLIDAYMLQSSDLKNQYDAYLDGMFLNLEPYIPQFAPNYDHLRKSYHMVAETKTPTGRAAGFWQLTSSPSWTTYGPFGRSDWLKELGLNMPETYDELHDVLVAFRDKYSPAAPLAIMNNGVDDWMVAGFGTRILGSRTSDAFIQKDGKVVLGVLEPGAKEYAEMMAKWYSEGLIDKDFVSREIAPAEDTTLIFEGKVGIGRASFLTTESIISYAIASRAAMPEGFDFAAFPIPVKSEGDTRNLSVGGTELSRKTSIINCISIRCANPESLIKWFDYFYTDEGALLANYGLINEGYTLNQNGQVQMTGMMYSSTDSLESAHAKYAMSNYQACHYDPFREYTPKNREKMVNTVQTFDSNWVDAYSIPSAVAMTESEAIEYALIMVDVGTYIEETFARFITGETPISEYDSKMSVLDNMNYKRAVELWQNAYDRYLVLCK